MTSPLDHARALLARARDDFYVVRRHIDPERFDGFVVRTIDWAVEHLKKAD